MKNRILLTGVWIGLVLLIGCSENPEKQAVSTTVEKASPQVEQTGKPTAIIETDKGSITVALLEDVAPETVAAFIELADVGFYNRTSFHRVMVDRMIQGGDPLSRDRDPYNDGQGTSGSYLPQEFSDIPVERGTVAMGREEYGDNGGSCQFFIVLQRTSEWDGQYNVFGKVIEGIEVAEEISRAPLTKSDHPSQKYKPAGKQIIKRVSIEYR